LPDRHDWYSRARQRLTAGGWNWSAFLRTMFRMISEQSSETSEFDMDVCLEIISGSSAGEKFSLQIAQRRQIGRGQNADIAVAADPLLSELHFAVWWDGKSCRIRDLESVGGTFLNGCRITEAAVRNGDKIVAGQTHFVVQVKRDLGPRPLASVTLQPKDVESDQLPVAESLGLESRTPEPQELIKFLRSQSQPLYAILDAARDPKVIAVLRNSNEKYQSLYEGLNGEVLALCAPYLVELPSKSLLIETLVREGWGKSWGICLLSEAGFKETRRHFRHFLMVKTEDGRDLYFRFYDPRVLRVFLPTCTRLEVAEFFGPVTAYFCEDKIPGNLLVMEPGADGVLKECVKLSGTAAETNDAPVSPQSREVKSLQAALYDQ
jgi:hypothetical protein